MNRAKIICHILMSIDGRIAGDFFRFSETGKAAAEYQHIRKKLGGEDHLNCTQAMEKLYEQFVVRTPLLQGGGLANAAFAAEGLIDELSLVIAPSLQGGGAPCLMESVRGLPPNSYVLCGIQTLPGGGLWLRYTKK